jgi:short-subunit dehydrogenase
MISYTLITGASGGIGEQLAILSAQRGKHLILVARNKETLEKVAQPLREQYNVFVHCLDFDLSHPSSSEELFSIIQSNLWNVETLINNAGYGLNGMFSSHALEDEVAMLQCNITSLVSLCSLFSKPMIQRGKGEILNIASTASYSGIPYLASYAASKAFVKNFSIGIHSELKQFGVTVSCCCPGGTSTNFFQRAKVDRSAMTVPLQTPEMVAFIALEGLENKKALTISGWYNAIMVFVTRLFPSSFNAYVSEQIFKPKNK